MAAAEPRYFLAASERSELEALAAQRCAQARLVERARIVLRVADGLSDSDIARELRCSRETARRWRQRYPVRREQEPLKPVAVWLADDTRVGRPATIPDAFWVDLLALATSHPADHGKAFTHWTSEELVDLVVEKGLLPSISSSYVREFLGSASLKPHRIKEWMNRREDPEFDARAAKVKELTAEASHAPKGLHVVLSFDEKTGMQAKERIAPPQKMRSGQPERLEFEYKRHGTLVLFAFFVLSTGAIIARLGETRTNVDTARVFGSELGFALAAGAKRVDVVLDQLNTHWSRELVLAIAKLCDLPTPGEEVLAAGKTMRAWLEQADKPVVFHYTPKHASWLNPVEIWFGVLVRKVLRRGSFCSKEDLATKVDAFVRYYNERFAHPYNLKRYWKAAS
jgi:transposase